jgi:Zn-dependent protease with chaperone function
MRAALLDFAYALAVAWSAPALLTPLTSRGISPRLGLTAWLTAMASVLTCLGLALVFLVRAAVAGWPRLAEAVCRSVAGGACTPRVYRNALFESGLSAVAVVAVLTATALAWCYGRRIQRARQGNRKHAEAARMTGRRLPGALGDSGAVVLDSPRPVAYCVPGRPAAIVLSTGALAVLDPPQLTAVLAHERAHLTGRHHPVITLTRGLGATFPAVPLFTRGPAEVARLAEMCADDVAARHSGRPTLVTALLAMGTGTAVPSTDLPVTALAATAYAVAARVQRLLEPLRRARRARCGLTLIGVTLLLALVSGLAAVSGLPTLPA